MSMAKKLNASNSESDESDGFKSSKAQKKREEKSERRAEAAAKWAEARRLAAEEEEKELKRRGGTSKVTQEVLRRRKEEEEAEMRRRVEEEKRRQNRTANKWEYMRMVSVANTNRSFDIDARTVEEAVAQLMVDDDALLPDRHPERRIKGVFKAFEEAELRRLKEEKPGLTLSQYKDAISKLWKKSPNNPFNQTNGGFGSQMQLKAH